MIRRCEKILPSVSELDLARSFFPGTSEQIRLHRAQNGQDHKESANDHTFPRSPCFLLNYIRIVYFQIAKMMAHVIQCKRLVREVMLRTFHIPATKINPMTIRRHH